MQFQLVCEREDDGRWIAEIEAIPGVLAYGASANEAMARAEVLALRVLAELERAPHRTLSVAALAAKYSVRDMIESRLDQLADGAFLEIDPDGGLFLRPRGSAFGRFVAGGRRMFGITSAN